MNRYNKLRLAILVLCSCSVMQSAQRVAHLFYKNRRELIGLTGLAGYNLLQHEEYNRKEENRRWKRLVDPAFRDPGSVYPSEIQKYQVGRFSEDMKRK